MLKFQNIDIIKRYICNILYIFINILEIFLENGLIEIMIKKYQNTSDKEENIGRINEK